jgi:SnoaL-like domain
LRLDLVFTDDAVFDATCVGNPEPYRGIDEIRAMFARPKPGHTPSHMTTNVYVYEDGDLVRVKSKWQATYWDRDGIRMGDYDDVVVELEGGWRIRERVLTLRQQ